MLQSMGLQRVGHDKVTDNQQQSYTVFTIVLYFSNFLSVFEDLKLPSSFATGQNLFPHFIRNCRRVWTVCLASRLTLGFLFWAFSFCITVYLLDEHKYSMRYLGYLKFF